MTKLFGFLLATLIILDSLLGLLSPARWRQLWQDIASYLPGSAADYIDEMVQVTENHREKSPSAVSACFALELGVGLLMLKLSRRARWR